MPVCICTGWTVCRGAMDGKERRAHGGRIARMLVRFCEKKLY